MAYPQAQAYFPGVNQILGLSFTLSHGITPSSGILDCAPQAEFSNLSGNLLLTFPGMADILLPNCLIDNSKVIRNAQGMIVRFTLFDKRWLWRWPAISGSYNVRMEDGTLDPMLLRTPQQLATALFTQLGETNFDVSQLPNSTYPPIVWDNELAARALQDLCDQLGCRVVLAVNNGSVSICQQGTGYTPPPGFFLQTTLGITPPQTPDNIGIVCGPSRYQADFILEAVGKDVDGTIKPIDKLSYAPPPAVGWQYTGPPDFGNIPDLPNPITGISPRQLARETVFRWYRIDMLPTQNFFGAPDENTGYLSVIVPGYPGPPLQDIRQILPLDDKQVQTYLDSTEVPLGQQQDAANGQPRGILRSYEPWVYGIFYDGNIAMQNTEQQPSIGGKDARYTPYPTYKLPFTIDQAHGIVQFQQAVYSLGEDPQGQRVFVEASLVLRVAVRVRNFGSWDFSRYVYTLPVNNPPLGTGSQFISHDEMVAQSIPTYVLDDNGNLTVRSIADNTAALIPEANYYILAEAAQYVNTQQAEFVYTGLWNIELDGLKQQISWTLGRGQPATTSVSVNNEFDHRVPPYRMREMLEDLRDDTIRKLKDLASKVARSKDLSDEVARYVNWF